MPAHFTPRTHPGSQNKNDMLHPQSQSSQDSAKVVPKARLEDTQQQVNDIVEIMKTNVERIMEREEKLTELDQRANHLSASASEFKMTARKVKKKYWWKNVKMMIILGCVIFLVIVVIIVTTVAISRSSGGSDANPSPSQTVLPTVTSLKEARDISERLQQLV
ncbi:vesicle-associated membrane protein 3-like [Procambarus clarkii]|uniref:vesicle-associated membrane protein 3-like n=1 Tax=Procambarus clarkii TaxID=6728 RepID=UPI0037433DDE